jgi:hypothetical protein
MPGPDYGHTASEKYLNSRKLSIYGGSNEIQRNIISERLLGMPREAAPDREAAFKDVKRNTIQTRKG